MLFISPHGIDTLNNPVSVFYFLGSPSFTDDWNVVQYMVVHTLLGEYQTTFLQEGGMFLVSSPDTFSFPETEMVSFRDELKGLIFRIKVDTIHSKGQVFQKTFYFRHGPGALFVN